MKSHKPTDMTTHFANTHHPQVTTPSDSYQLTVAAKEPFPILQQILQLSAHMHVACRIHATSLDCAATPRRRHLSTCRWCRAILKPQDARHATDNDREARSLVPVAYSKGSNYWADSATRRNTQELNVSVVIRNFSSELE